MTTYEVLTCNICSKSVNRSINTSHITINKCNLTKNCKGTLQNVLTLENPIAVEKKYNWESRFTPDVIAQQTPNKKISLLTGNNNISFAVKRNGFLTNDYNISLNASPTVLIESIEYVYNKTSGVRYINGFDSSLNKRFMIYDISKHDVSVYLNNVLLNENQFDRSVINQIRLDFPTTLFNNIIRVVVSKKVPIVDMTLATSRNYSPDNTSCYSGIATLSIFNGINTDKKYNVYHVNNVSEVFSTNTRYTFKNVTDEIYMLIGDSTRKQNDTLLTHAIPITDGMSFVYTDDILVEYSTLVELYPPFNILEYFNINHTYNTTQQYSNIITTKNIL